MRPSRIGRLTSRQPVAPSVESTLKAIVDRQRVKQANVAAKDDSVHIPDYDSVPKVARAEAGPLLEDAVQHGDRLYEAANGHVWKVVTAEDGTESLVRDEDMTSDNMAVRDLMEGGA